MNTKALIERARELAKLRETARPGPWYVIPHPEWGGADSRIDDRPDAPWANFAQICYASPRNAPLIAAAPAMAETLEEMADRLIELEDWKRFAADLGIDMNRIKTMAKGEQRSRGPSRREDHDA